MMMKCNVTHSRGIWLALPLRSQGIRKGCLGEMTTLEFMLTR